MVGLSTLFSTTVYAATHYSTPARGSQTILPLHTLSTYLTKLNLGVLAILPADPANAGAAAAAAALAADTCSLYPALNGSSFGGSAFASPALRSLVLPPLCASVSTAFMAGGEAALQDAIRRPSYPDRETPRVWAAIVINSGPPAWDYAIRMNASDVPDTSRTVNTYTTVYDPAPLRRYISGGSTSLPVPGFSSLQLLVDRFILGGRLGPALPPASTLALLTYATTTLLPGSQSAAATKALASELASSPAKAAAAAAFLASETRLPQQIDLIPFPTPQYSTNVFFSQVLYSLTFLFVIACE